MKPYRPYRPLEKDLPNQTPFVRDRKYAELARAHEAPSPSEQVVGWFTPVRRWLGMLAPRNPRHNKATAQALREMKEERYPLTPREREDLEQQMDLKDAVERADPEAVLSQLSQLTGEEKRLGLDLVLRLGSWGLHQAVGPQMEADLNGDMFLEWVIQGIQDRPLAEAVWRIEQILPRINPAQGAPFAALSFSLRQALAGDQETLRDGILRLLCPSGDLRPSAQAQEMVGLIQERRPDFLLPFWQTWTTPESRQAWLTEHPGKFTELEAWVRSQARQQTLQARAATTAPHSRRRS